MANFRKDDIITNSEGKRVWIDSVHGNGVYTVHIGDNMTQYTMYQVELEAMKRNPGKNRGGRNNRAKSK